MGGRRGRGKSRNIYRGPMDKDKGVGLTMGVGGAGKVNGEKCGTTEIEQQ